MIVVGRGHLGPQIAQAFHADLWPGSIADLTRAIRRGEIDANRPIINAAGKTDLGWCESHAAETIYANIADPLALASVSRRLIHLSSGCVWDGPHREDGQPFGPADPPSPTCVYSWTKAACDALIPTAAAGLWAILRPRQVFSALRHPRNMLTKLLSYPRLIDTPQSVTSLDTLIATIEILVRSAMMHTLWDRVTCVYDRGTISPLQIGRLLAARGLCPQPELLTKEHLDQWHRPKRVDVVMHDPVFEAAVQPLGAIGQIDRAIEGWT